MPNAARDAPNPGPGQQADEPVRFFRWSSLVYPLLHPTWVRWIVLSFVTALAAGMIALTAKGFSEGLGPLKALVTVCLALSAYLAASFVEIIEQTAHGSDRLNHLPGFAWLEILRPFAQTAGAAVIAALAAYGLSYPLRGYLTDTQLHLIRAISVFQLFPILLMSNLADQRWLPIASLPTTLNRFSCCAGSFVLFLIVSAVTTVVTVAPLLLLTAWDFGAGLAASGPLLSTWFMLYGHWLGRLARQLMRIE